MEYKLLDLPERELARKRRFWKIVTGVAAAIGATTMLLAILVDHFGKRDLLNEPWLQGGIVVEGLAMLLVGFLANRYYK